MGLYRGTVSGETLEGDQIEFTVTFRLICPAHFTEQECLAEARRDFDEKYGRRFSERMFGYMRSFTSWVETVVRGNQEPING